MEAAALRRLIGRAQGRRATERPKVTGDEAASGLISRIARGRCGCPGVTTTPVVSDSAAASAAAVLLIVARSVGSAVIARQRGR